MIPIRTRFEILVVALCATLLTSVHADPVAGNLTGAWRLDHAASDLGGGPESDEGGPASGRPPGRGPRGGGFGRGGGGMGPGSGRGEPGELDRDQMKDRLERIRALMEPIERLTITQDAERIVIVDGQGRSERIVPNDTKEQHLVGNVQAELKSRWEDGRLVSEIALGHRTTFTRTISVEEGTDGVRRLTIAIEPKDGGRGDTRAARRVYELIE